MVFQEKLTLNELELYKSWVGHLIHIICSKIVIIIQ